LDNIKGLNLFDVFQSVLGFLAPSLSVVFLLTVFWKRTTKRTVNIILSFGSLFSLSIGVLYLWILTPDQYHFWPHYLLLSFDIFLVLMISAILITLFDRTGTTQDHILKENVPTTSKKVKLSFFLLGLVILFLYSFSIESNEKIISTVILIFSAVNLFAQQATWIWYPGDFEINLANKVQNRRTERNTFFPVFWKMDAHFVLVDFHKIFDLSAEEIVDINVEGEYNVKIDGKAFEGMPKRITVPAGKHKINIKVYNQANVPAIL